MATRGRSPDLWQHDTDLPADPVLVAPFGRYGGDRIVAGARFLSRLDPGWWREGGWLPAVLTALDLADPYRCVLAWWAAQCLPTSPRGGARQLPPYDRAMLALGLSSRQAQALGFTGADADLLTPGWRQLITYLRAAGDQRAAMARASRGGTIRDTMTDRYAKALARLEGRLRRSPGELAPEARAAAIDAGPLPDPLAQRYVETVRQHAYQLTDRRLEELAQAGWTEGQVFELTVAAAFGAAKRRLDAGLAALGEAAGPAGQPGEG